MTPEEHAAYERGYLKGKLDYEYDLFSKVLTRENMAQWILDAAQTVEQNTRLESMWDTQVEEPGVD